MAINLGQLILFVRGLHLSSLHGDIDFDKQIIIRPKDNNTYDPNDVKITNGEGVFVSRIAIQ